MTIPPRDLRFLLAESRRRTIEAVKEMVEKELKKDERSYKRAFEQVATLGEDEKNAVSHEYVGVKSVYLVLLARLTAMK